METNGEVLTEATKSLNDFKSTAMNQIMRKRELDEDTVKDLGLLTLYLNTAVSNIDGAKSLYESLMAEPADGMPMETAIKEN